MGTIIRGHETLIIWFDSSAKMHSRIFLFSSNLHSGALDLENYCVLPQLPIGYYQTVQISPKHISQFHSSSSFKNQQCGFRATNCQISSSFTKCQIYNDIFLSVLKLHSFCTYQILQLLLSTGGTSTGGSVCLFVCLSVCLFEKKKIEKQVW